MTYALPVVEAAYKFKDQSIEDGAFFRAVMAHDTWWVVAKASDGGVSLGHLQTERGAFLDIFSSRSLIPAFEEREGPIGHELQEIPGFVLFGLFEDHLFDRVNVDTHHPHAFHFFAHQLPLLRAWARIVAVELALAEPDRIPDPFAVLRRFEEFQLVMRADEAPPLTADEENAVAGELVLAPDPDRTLAAIFTAPDRVDAFLRHANAEWDGHFWAVTHSGSTLFAMLRGMDVDGLVFNPMTDGPTIALHAGVLEVLASGS